jgi:hypothetical protein
LSIICLSISNIYFSNSEKSNKSNAMANFQSLIAFKSVILKLSTNSVFIPYNLSKLKLTLKETLGGNCKTFFFACVIPENKSESLSTLNVALNASKIVNKQIISDNLELLQSQSRVSNRYSI